MSDVATLDKQLNEQILAGDILGAFDKYYADSVVMTEPNGTREGKAANREYEEKFVNSLEQVHGVELKTSAVDGNRSLSEWVMDVTFKDGNRVKMEQVAAREWKDGQVVFERFYYNA